MFITKLALIEWITIFLFSLAVAYAQPQVPPSPTSAAPQRVKVDADTASAMVVQRTPIRYPDAARSARIQGTVVLKVIVNISGDVQEATVISGDPALAQATVDAVKQWKYKPYQAEGSPAEMETQVSIGFHLKVPPQVAPPPLGTFRDGSYSNDFFGVNYPLSRDWVRETDLTRSNLASAKDSQGVSVLLAAVHVPQNTDTLTADSSFVVLAENSAAEDCRHYLTSVANTVQSEKDGQQKGDISQFTIASHDFYRADFGFRHGTNNRTFVCTLIKDYMLHWNIVALSKQAVETAISTLSAISFSPPTTPVESPVAAVTEPTPAMKVRVSQGITQGLLIKHDAPVYPPEAKYNHIQGSVLMNAVISKTGDVTDLEVISGPSDLVPSSVSAVRKWKYRPYLLKGEPVEVQTTITINYQLQ